MTFKEVSVVQVREVLRRWLRGTEGLRRVADGAGVDRKTVRRYVEAAEALGVIRDGGEVQLSDELVAAVVEKVRPGRPSGHGEAWAVLESHHDKVKELLDKGLTVVKVGDLLTRRGIVVPERTLWRYCAERCSAGRLNDTVPLADPEPGRELQADFGRMGLLFDPVSARRRVVHAVDLGRGLVPPHVRLVDLHPDHGRRHRGLGAGLGVLRWHFPRAHPRLCGAEHNRGSVPVRVMLPSRKADREVGVVTGVNERLLAGAGT